MAASSRQPQKISLQSLTLDPQFVINSSLSLPDGKVLFAGYRTHQEETYGYLETWDVKTNTKVAAIRTDNMEVLHASIPHISKKAHAIVTAPGPATAVVVACDSANAKPSTDKPAASTVIATTVTSHLEDRKASPKSPTIIVTMEREKKDDVIIYRFRDKDTLGPMSQHKYPMPTMFPPVPEIAFPLPFFGSQQQCDNSWALNPTTRRLLCRDRGQVYNFYGWHQVNTASQIFFTSPNQLTVVYPDPFMGNLNADERYMYHHQPSNRGTSLPIALPVEVRNYSAGSFFHDDRHIVVAEKPYTDERNPNSTPIRLGVYDTQSRKKYLVGDMKSRVISLAVLPHSFDVVAAHADRSVCVYDMSCYFNRSSDPEQQEKEFFNFGANASDECQVKARIAKNTAGFFDRVKSALDRDTKLAKPVDVKVEELIPAGQAPENARVTVASVDTNGRAKILVTAKQGGAVRFFDRPSHPDRVAIKIAQLVDTKNLSILPPELVEIIANYADLSKPGHEIRQPTAMPGPGISLN